MVKQKTAFIVFLSNDYSGDEDIFVTTSRQRFEKAEEDNDYALRLSTSSTVENFSSLEDCINAFIERGMRCGGVARGSIY